MRHDLRLQPFPRQFPWCQDRGLDGEETGLADPVDYGVEGRVEIQTVAD
jgi:hypothetical protein